MEERRGKGYFVEGALLVAGRAVVEVLLAHSWVRWLGRNWGGCLKCRVVGKGGSEVHLFGSRLWTRVMG